TRAAVAVLATGGRRVPAAGQTAGGSPPSEAPRRRGRPRRRAGAAPPERRQGRRASSGASSGQSWVGPPFGREYLPRGGEGWAGLSQPGHSISLGGLRDRGGRPGKQEGTFVFRPQARQRMSGLWS